MAIDSKNVADRREVTYSSYEDLLADARNLAGQETRVLGNWTFPQILEHLGLALEGSIDGVPFRMPWIVRIMARTFLKKRILSNPLSPGFKMPESAKQQIYPRVDISLDEALKHLEQGVLRCKGESSRTRHPLFDTISREEWDAWNLRHAEMHMSFVHPASE